MTVQCTVCNGEGGWEVLDDDGLEHHWDPCDECNQTGYVEEECRECSGSGYVDDPEGDEEEECEVCEGTGWW